MKDIKDNFTAQAGAYAQFRPVYPQELYEFLLSLVQHKKLAWDCGTGNGQVAIALSTAFEKVLATDISQQQLNNAKQAENIFYSLQRAEKTDFPDNIFGLITVAQAIHWFDFELFYREVKRTAINGGIIAVIGYALVRGDDSLNNIIDEFYQNIIGPYWDAERKYIDENYQTIPFSFKEIKSPEFNHFVDWSLDAFIGYLGTWSAVEHYKKKNLSDPVERIAAALQAIWPPGTNRKLRFPILLRAGVIGK